MDDLRHELERQDDLLAVQKHTADKIDEAPSDGEAAARRSGGDGDSWG